MGRKYVARIPTVFGRLAFLASLRESMEGRYTLPAFSDSLGEEEADRALGLLHHRLFSQWLAFSLTEQKADLDRYLEEAELPRPVSRFRLLVPSAAREVERALFFTDLETLLELSGLGAGPSR
jgi:hypothetical protein